MTQTVAAYPSTDVGPTTLMRPVYALFRADSLYAGAALLMALLMLPTAAALLTDTRTVLDANVWIKPLKFQFSLVVYLGTLAWFSRWLPVSTTQGERAHGTAWRGYRVVIVGCAFVEIVWIMGAAMFATQSHFNVSSPLMATLYPLMGVVAVVLTSAALVYGIRIGTNRASTLKPEMRTALAAGLILTFLATVPVAGYLAGAGSHYVGQVPAGANGLPVLGWSRVGGDLRVAHFFATHAMHVIPAAGYLISRVNGMQHKLNLTMLVTAAYAGLILYTFVQATRGLPFMSWL